jgi:hypothetical protein
MSGRCDIPRLLVVIREFFIKILSHLDHKAG